MVMTFASGVGKGGKIAIGNVTRVPIAWTWARRSI